MPKLFNDLDDQLEANAILDGLRSQAGVEANIEDILLTDNGINVNAVRRITIKAKTTDGNIVECINDVDGLRTNICGDIYSTIREINRKIEEQRS
jgi:hypothetical protein